MPLYEYSCPKCGRFELIRKFSDAPVAVCPTCGKKVQKLPSAPAIQYKGTGWYVTDYSRKSSGGDNASKGDTPATPSDSSAKPSEGSTSKDSATPAKESKKK
ncbi:MAG: FmdB family zinc ribbon protein [Vicinamibacteria bacterium]